ncbi:armadillo-type protein [Mycena crocata]|nr:armadillo-type protein [Mycena crocata]
MLGRLAKHKSTLDVVLSINLCMRRLVALLYDDDAFVVEKAIQAIATAVVGAKALEVVPKLLQSRNNQVRQFTCNMLSRLVKYKFTLDAVLSINLCIRRLIDLLYDDNTLAAEQAMQAIATIASYPAGAKAVVGAKTLEFVPELLQSPYQPLLRRQTCYMLGNLADHEYTLDAVLASVHCIRCLVRHLVSLLRNDISLVVEGAIYALSKLAKERNAAKAIVRAGVLNFVAELTELDSTNTAIQTYTCLMLCRLARCPPLHLSI